MKSLEIGMASSREATEELRSIILLRKVFPAGTTFLGWPTRGKKRAVRGRVGGGEAVVTPGPGAGMNLRLSLVRSCVFQVQKCFGQRGSCHQNELPATFPKTVVGMMILIICATVDANQLGRVINPRRACAARATVLGPFVCLSVCYHVFCHHAQRDNEIAISKGSALHRLDFKFGDFRKSNAFESTK